MNQEDLDKSQTVTIQAAGVSLGGSLGFPIREFATIAQITNGVVVFAHGSGSSRFSPRNQLVARVLRQNGFATLLLDLLTQEEQYDINKRFDISLLTTRLAEAVRWTREHPTLKELPLGIFGASTGAAAALRVAAIAESVVNAVVSRGGRTDLTGPLISRVKAPTLLLVGSEDHDVIALNHESLEALTCTKRLALIPGATHLFEEQGALDDVAHLATYWFKNYLGQSINTDGAKSIEEGSAALQ